MTAQVLEQQTAEIHRSHRDVTGGWLRPATFGVMDGLVSNFALVAGVVGGGATGKIVIMTGLAGLVAGACSMASGEFTSVSSSASTPTTCRRPGSRPDRRSPPLPSARWFR